MNNGILKKKKICVLNVYFGNWPRWMPFFLVSCELNADIDFIFFSDIPLPCDTPSNIRSVQLTKDNFNSLATKKLGFTTEIKNPYKICDFKPTFGKIFEDYLIGYEFWGYTDIDLIFGRISNFITQKVLEENDIISMYKGFLSGPFCLYRNQAFINNLYKNVKEYRQKLQNLYCTGFDEKVHRPDLKGFNITKLIFFISFFFHSILSNKISIFNIKEIRYQFQWCYKKHKIKHNTPIDMTEIIWQEDQSNKIRVHFKDKLPSDSFFIRNRKFYWNLKWSSAGFYDQSNNTELFAFHFRDSKTKSIFKVGLPKTVDVFFITQDGIFT